MKTTEHVLNAIRKHAEATYPEECCGFLLGKAGTVNEGVRIHRVPNRQQTNRERRYTITPEDYRAADQDARDHDQDIVGFYHSHPDHPAKPSPTDLEEATFPGYTYIIVSVHNGEAGAITAWRLAADRSQFHQEQLTTTRSLSSQ